MIATIMHFSHYYFDARVPKYRWKRQFILKHFFCQGAERAIADCEQVDIEFTKLRNYAKMGNEAWVSCSKKLDDAITEPVVSISSGLVKQKFYVY